MIKVLDTQCHLDFLDFQFLILDQNQYRIDTHYSTIIDECYFNYLIK